MGTPPLTDDEKRVEALRHYDVFDTPPEKTFDTLAELAARCCRTPIAFICFVGRNRQWFKAIIRLDLADPDPHLAFCYYSILKRDLLVVPDAAQDSRFARISLVASEPHLRFYAAAPLVTPSSYVIGCLAVMDRMPRELEAGQAEALQMLATQVMALLESRRQTSEPDRAVALRKRVARPQPGELALFEQSHVAQLLVDSLSSSIVDANMWWQRVSDLEAAMQVLPLDLQPGQHYAQAWAESRHPEDRERMDAIGTAALREGLFSYSQEFRCFNKYGEIRWLYEDVSLQPSGPGRWRAVGVCTDVTERKQAGQEHTRLIMEQAARAEAEAVQQRLREADQRKDEFLAMLGHELRNPLASIVNALSIWRMRADPPTLERVRDLLERQVRHMARLVDDLLDVSRIVRGKTAVQKELVDFRHLLDQTAEDHRRALEGAGLAFTLDLPEAPIWVEGDSTRLSQVLGNLLHNAAKFTGTGGQVALQVTLEEARVLVSIRDTGIGIEQEMLERIFEPFAQAERGVERSRGGLGLGLALAKGWIELHGGEVKAQSVGLGRGAELNFWLPLCPAAAVPAESRSVSPTASSVRVLIIEDNEDAALTLRDLLELSGHDAVVTHSGAAGVAMARQLQPEVILCDIGLPGMDGYEVARALRQDATMARTRLIALSGYGQPEDRQRSEEAGFDWHLTKPADPEELQRLLGTLLANAPSAAAAIGMEHGGEHEGEHEHEDKREGESE